MAIGLGSKTNVAFAMLTSLLIIQSAVYMPQINKIEEQYKEQESNCEEKIDQQSIVIETLLNQSQDMLINISNLNNLIFELESQIASSENVPSNSSPNDQLISDLYNYISILENISSTQSQLMEGINEKIEQMDSEIYDIEHQLYPNGTLMNSSHNDSLYTYISILENISSTQSQLMEGMNEKIEQMESEIYDIEHQLYPNGTLMGPGHNGSKYLVITIDVEAQPPRQSDEHVERLVYGNFSEGRSGIIEMMNAADNEGMKLTFFVDVLEEFLYPGEITKVLNDINDRGHDIQLHSHAEFLPNEIWDSWQNDPLWDELGAKKEWAPNCWDKPTALFILNKLLEIVEQAGIENRPIAYRGGGLRYSAGTLDAMSELGLNYSYNYNPPSLSQTFKVGHQPLFQWSNGVYELPIGYLTDTWSRLDNSEWNDTELELEEKFDTFFDNAKGDAVLVMLIHSWQFLGTVDDEIDDEYNYVYDGEWRLQSFEQFLSNLPDDVHVISTSELSEKIESGEIEPYWQFDQNRINICS